MHGVNIEHLYEVNEVVVRIWRGYMVTYFVFAYFLPFCGVALSKYPTYKRKDYRPQGSNPVGGSL